MNEDKIIRSAFLARLKLNDDKNSTWCGYCEAYPMDTGGCDTANFSTETRGSIKEVKVI